MGVIMRSTLLTAIIFCGLLLAFQGKAQDIRAVFNEGKAMFDREQYALALLKLEPLANAEADNDLIRYASFYYAVSAYESNDPKTATETFSRIVERFPDWEYLNESRFWLGKLAFEDQQYETALGHLDAITDPALAPQIQALQDFHFARITDEQQLKRLLELKPAATVLASQLADQILKLDVANQDIDLLNELSERYNLNLNLGIEGIESSPKKAVYNVGVFLPFTFREDSVGLLRQRTAWPTRFFEGAQLGVEKLKEEGIDLNLLSFDTRDDTTSLTEMLQTEDAKNLDFIVGPVFQSSVLQVAAFAKEQQINMLNPLSSNGDIIKDNPFAFLYYPSHESLAIAAAEYATANFRENKNVAIFYSGFSDKPRADLYRDILEKDSFNIAIFEQVAGQESSKISLMFVEEEEVDKDSLVVEAMLAEMDSLREAEVKDWEIYDPEDFVLDSLIIRPDSIGHIFIASDVSSLSAAAISAIEARPDTMLYLGTSRWLSAEQSISFEQLERTNAVFTGSNWLNYDTEAVDDFRARYLAEFNAYPKKEERLGDAYIAYDIIVTYGRLLHQYGKYFQVGLKRKERIEAELTDGFDYRFSNDNRYIPVLRITESQVVPVQKNEE